MEIISRKEAKAQGLVHYFTGKPCLHGHLAKRNTKNTAGQQLLVMDTASGKSVLLFRDETKDYIDNG